jgi:hypothetical protein
MGRASTLRAAIASYRSDVGDVSWVVPYARIEFPAQPVGIPFHHWSAGVCAATSIAHKGIPRPNRTRRGFHVSAQWRKSLNGYKRRSTIENIETPLPNWRGNLRCAALEGRNTGRVIVLLTTRCCHRFWAPRAPRRASLLCRPRHRWRWSSALQTARPRLRRADRPGTAGR